MIILIWLIYIFVIYQLIQAGLIIKNFYHKNPLFVKNLIINPKPSEIIFHKNSSIPKYVSFKKNKKLHNDKGPAFYSFNSYGYEISNCYCLYGQILSKVQFEYILEFQEEDRLNVIMIEFI